MPQEEETVASPSDDTSAATSEATTATRTPQFEFRFSGQVTAPQVAPRRNDDEAKEGESDDEAGEEEHDPYFEPLVFLPLIDIITCEEDEETLWSGRAKLYRYDEDEHTHEMEWKERGLGDVKLLKHKVRGSVRILMRREQTLKVCANHAILPEMTLNPHTHSDRTWVWSTPADFSELTPHEEMLAIRFKTPEIAMQFRESFNEAKVIMTEYMEKRKEKLHSASTDENTDVDELEKKVDKVALGDVESEQ
uniref:RanBD1 domain-containing protein n=1 Tax=Plectus sambesii TaxID=2011161 RepID=A0A914V9E7_9BILA